MEKLLTDSGAKAYQRADTENRIAPYMEWHRTLERGLYMTDVDSIEWMMADGEPVPVGVIEVTRVDMGVEVTQNYLDAIIQRFEQRDFQAKTARTVAKLLGVMAFIVLFREDCSEFWIYNLSGGEKWVYATPAKYQTFLKWLRQQKLKCAS